MSIPTSLVLRDIETLFRPFRHRKLELPTRVVMAPMSRNFASNGIPAPEMALYYRRRAEHELGLIITEGAAIDDPAAAADAGDPSFFGGAALRAWKAICTAVHATDCKIVPQLWHAGMAREAGAAAPGSYAAPVGPSGIDPVSLQQAAPPMSRSRMAAIAASFARAAAHAKALGFDGVEIQGAHGYLIDQFLWAETNKRTDEYGGSIAARARFACEVVQAVRKAVGSRFPILFRLSQWKIEHYGARLAETPDELAELLQPICDSGVDIFDCSLRHYACPEFEGSPLNLAGWVRKLTGKPVIAVGSVGLDVVFSIESLQSPAPAPRADLTRLVQMMGANEFDLIAVGRALLADPAWAHKLHMGQESELMPFTRRSLGRLH